MNTELFISKRLFFEKSNQHFLSQKIIRIALFGIALSLAVMIVAVAVITGFKKEIRNKVIGFGSHIQITHFDARNSHELPPVSKNQPFLAKISPIKNIQKIQVFATKPGLIKTDETHQGIVFKGFDKNYNSVFFEKNLIDGQLPQINDSVRSNEIIISEIIANMLQLKTGDQTLLYFINEIETTPRMLQLKVSGIYRTNLEEFDNIFILGDLKQIQRLNDWTADQVSGFEIFVNNFENIAQVEEQVRSAMINYSEENEMLRPESILSQYPQIFDWLSVLDMNVWVILSLMVAVAGFNMISGLLVLILERSTMIGVLKALGSPNHSIRKVFLYLTVFMTGKGMLWGNAIGIVLVMVQKYFHVIKLNPATYYVEMVPVNLSVAHLILLNIGSIVITTLMLVLPSYFISKISPEKSIRFD